MDSQKSEVLYQVTGYSILSRLFMRGQQPNSRGANEFLDQVATSLAEGNACAMSAWWSSALCKP